MSASPAKNKPEQRRRVDVYEFGHVDYQADSQRLSGSFQMAGFPTAADIRERMVVHKRAAKLPRRDRGAKPDSR